MRGMMGMRGIRLGMREIMVGMMGIRGIRLGIMRIRVGMQGNADNQDE